MMPSPHCAKHWYGTDVCWAGGKLVFSVPHKGSLVQVGEQPSYGNVLPSSHCSGPRTVPPAFEGPSTVPLPQYGVAFCECGFLLGSHTKPGFSLQVAVQHGTSAFSSHCSSPTTMPSPHTGMHCVPASGHAQPAMIWQVAEQPCLPSFTPSSHVSVPVTLPSPHFIGTHRPPFAGQFAPGMMVQVELQPCTLSTRPSSHFSVPAKMPSPHLAATQAAPCVGHFQPASSLHVLEQPSPPFAFPSSHSSPVSTVPLPQMAGGGGGVKMHGWPTTEQV